MKAVDSVVADVEKVLKIISDDLLNEKCDRSVWDQYGMLI